MDTLKIIKKDENGIEINVMEGLDLIVHQNVENEITAGVRFDDEKYTNEEAHEYAMNFLDKMTDDIAQELI